MNVCFLVGIGRDGRWENVDHAYDRRSSGKINTDTKPLDHALYRVLCVFVIWGERLGS